MAVILYRKSEDGSIESKKVQTSALYSFLQSGWSTSLEEPRKVVIKEVEPQIELPEEIEEETEDKSSLVNTVKGWLNGNKD